MRIICLDVGVKSCGFAITDINQKIANPLENFNYSRNDKLQIIQRLKFWLKEYQNEIETILVGLPLDLNGYQTQTTTYVKEVILLIKNDPYFKNKQIVEFDERYSTKEGSELLMNLNIKASLRKKIKDKMAAFIILENYLNFLKIK